MDHHWVGNCAFYFLNRLEQVSFTQTDVTGGERLKVFSLVIESLTDWLLNRTTAAIVIAEFGQLVHKERRTHTFIF